jgi:hypothetical protein
MENYQLANALDQNGVTQDEMDMFHSVWQNYDPYATQFIKLEHMSDFLAELEAPFGCPKPNDKEIVLFDLPVVEGDLVHVVDVLHAVAKNACGTVDQNEEYDDMQMKLDLQFLNYFPNRVDYVPLYTTRHGNNAKPEKQELIKVD